MDPVGGDLFVVGCTQQPLSNQEKNGQKLAGNHQNVDEPVSQFFVKKALILTQEGKEYLYSDVIRIHES